MRPGRTGNSTMGGVAVAAMAALLLIPSETRAAPEPSDSDGVALLPLQVRGDLNAGWQDQIQGALTRGFVQAGMTVVPPDEVVAASGGVTTCANTKCWSFLSSSTGVRFLIQSEIEVKERNYVVTLDIIDGADGSTAASSQETCQLCGLAEVGELVTSQAAALRQKAEVLARGQAVLAVSSTPDGAIIYIDGKQVGAAPLERELPAGSHRAEARKEGYVTQSMTIDAVKGVRETLSFELLPETTSDDARSRRDVGVVLGWTTFGIGVAAVAAGGTFLGIDENPYRTRCSGPDIDAFGNCRQRYNTMIHGVALTAGGGALVLAGAAQLIAARVAKGKRRRNKSEVARRVGFGGGLRSVTVGVRF